MAIGLDPAFAARCGAVSIEGCARELGGAAVLLVAADRFAAFAHAGPPVLAIAADPGARAALLDGGAADALCPDADPAEIAARIRAVVRRGETMRCADLTIDPGDRSARRGGRPIALHPREFAVLAHLARHRDRPVTRPALYAAVWHRTFDPGTNVVAVTVSRLRAKVDAAAPRLIHTVAGGYMLSAVAQG